MYRALSILAIGPQTDKPHRERAMCLSVRCFILCWRTMEYRSRYLATKMLRTYNMTNIPPSSALQSLAFVVVSISPPHFLPANPTSGKRCLRCIHKRNFCFVYIWSCLHTASSAIADVVSLAIIIYTRIQVAALMTLKLTFIIYDIYRF